MSIRARVRGGAEQPIQRSMASDYTDALTERFEQQAALRTPRSTGAWSAEQTRPGSWATGLGALRTSGRGPGRPNGATDPRFSYKIEDDQ